MKLDEPIAIIGKKNFEMWANAALAIGPIGGILLRDILTLIEPKGSDTITWTTVSQLVQDYHNQFPEKEEAHEVELERPIQGKKRGRKPKIFNTQESTEIIVDNVDDEEIDLNKPLFVES